MSILTYPLGFLGGGKEFYNNVVENSLRFNDGDSPYLDHDWSKQPTNADKFTYSAWFKLSVAGGQEWFIGAKDTAESNIKIYANKIDVHLTGSNYNFITTAVFRDPSAWYHIVVVYDSQMGVVADRCRVYINAVRQPLGTTTTIPVGTDIEFTKNAVTTTMGAYAAGTHPFDGLLTDVYGIDGYALDPENFGEYKEGVWIPKAYAGPPPFITDSSSYSAHGSTGDGGGLDYDKSYIGESSMAGSAPSALNIFGSGDYSQYFFPAGTDWTYDFWIYPTNDAEGYLSFGLENIGTSDGTADHPLDGTGTTWYNFGYMMSGSSGSNWQLGGGGSWQYFPHTGATTEWHHISYIRHKDGQEGQIYHNGVLAKTITYSDDNQIIEPHFYMLPNSSQSWLSIGKGTGTNGAEIWIDEIRLVKGEVHPPRFYFGTNYGDQSGGRLPQRATSDDRFTDDERTILLVSGQSANNHARAVSLVDESGFHDDNVHFSNSTYSSYPTTDGIGTQFSIDGGVQHTTREKFIGNTSSMHFGGGAHIFTSGRNDGGAFMAVSEDTTATFGAIGTGQFTYDFWLWFEDVDNAGNDQGSQRYILDARSGTGDSVNNPHIYLSDRSTLNLSTRDGGYATVHTLPTPVTNHNWHHFSIIRTTTKIEAYYDGLLVPAGDGGAQSGWNNQIFGTTAASAYASPAATSAVGFHIGTQKAGNSRFHGYMDEFRVSAAANKPQIKWTHTQTAGAGNKDAYDVHAWRVHGHEFTDDNATSLLVHGDINRGGFTSANGYYFDGTTNTHVQSGTNITSDVTGTNTKSMAVWFTQNVGGDQVVAHFGDRNTGDWFAVYTGANDIYGSTYGGDTTAAGLIGLGVPTLAVITYSHSGTYPVKLYVNDTLYGTNDVGASHVTTAAGKLTIGQNITASNDIDYKFNGVVHQVCVWDIALTADMITDLYNAGPIGDWSSGTAINSGTNYGSTQVSARKIHYAFGNNPSGTADSATAIVDRSSGTNNGVGTSGAIPSTTGVAGSFVDSSSANSIAHALVSGGGVHHTKAVTLKSDGTNGTSTTDYLGNTIYWCGSNSSVTFANSSSFDYGNTAMVFSGASPEYLKAADSADFHFSNGEFWVDFWAYDTGESTTHGYIGQWVSGQKGWGLMYNDGSSGNLQFLYSTDGSNQTAITVGATSILTDGHWHHFAFGKDGTDFIFQLDGCVKHRVALSATLHNSTQWLEAGAQSGAAGYFAGFMDEVRVIKGAAYPSRFYLGNQAPITGSTLTTVKSLNFRKSSLEYYVSGTAISGIANLDYGTIVGWVKPGIGNYDSVLVASESSGTGAKHYRMGWGISSSRELLVATQDAATGGDFEIPLTTTTSDDSDWVMIASARENGVAYTYMGVGEGGTVHRAAIGGNNGDFLGTESSPATTFLSIGKSGLSSRTDYITGLVSQVAIYGGTGTGDHLGLGDLQSIYDLGPAGDARTVTTTNLFWYFNANLESGTRISGASPNKVYDLVTTDGTTDLSAGPAAATANTSYIYASGAKRPTRSRTNSAGHDSAVTTHFGNNHYADVTAGSISSESFGGFVDDEYTVLLLRGGHADGNTTFYDGGISAGETITFPTYSYSSGKTRQAKGPFTVASAPRHEISSSLGLHGSSIYFDGTDDILRIPTHPDFDGLGNDCKMTFEFWLYDSTWTSPHIPFQSGEGTTGGYFQYHSSNSPLGLHVMSDSGNKGNFGPAATGWHHYAIQSDMTDYYCFLDGVNTSKVAVGGVQLFMNGYTIDCGTGSGTYAWGGMIDELRITRGITRYTLDGASQSGIVPSTSTGAGSIGTSIPTSAYLRPTPYVAADGGRGYFANTNVKLWIKSDTFPGDTNFYDSSGDIGNTPKKITNYGHTAANRPLLKTANSATDYALSGGSDGIKFDGTGDKIVIPKHTDWVVRDHEDYTIEHWQYIDTIGNDWIYGTAASGSNYGVNLQIKDTAGVLAQYTVGGGWFNATPSATIAAGKWQHVVSQRHNGIHSIIVDGVCASTAADTNKFTAEADFTIGSHAHGPGHFDGKIDEFRFSKMPRYTAQGLIDSNYSNPSSEFGIQTEGSTYGRFDEQVTANTTYQRYNYQHKGFNSMSLDGTNDKLEKADPSGLASGNNDKSMAIWVKPNDSAPSTAHYLMSYGDKDDWSADKWFYFYLYDGSFWKGNHTGTDAQQQMSTFVAGEWYLLVATSTGGTGTTQIMRGYVNGMRGGLDIDFSDDMTMGTPDIIRIGATGNAGGTSNYINGDISNAGIWDVALSDAAIQDLYLKGPDGNWTTNGPNGDYTSITSSDLRAYYAFGNHDTVATSADQTGGSADNATTIQDRSGNGNHLTNSGATLGSNTKLLIHSNTDIDGDTSLVDSSASEHVIDRVQSDPVYANTGTNRANLGGASYNGIKFSDKDVLRVTNVNKTHNWPATNATDTQGDFTVAFWYYPVEGETDAVIFGGKQAGTATDALIIATRATATTIGIEFNNANDNPYVPLITGASAGAWHHIVYTRRGHGDEAIHGLRNGVYVATAAPTNGEAAIDFNHLNIGAGSGDFTDYLDGYLDQIIMIKGAALSNTHVASLYTSGAGNTAIASLGGLIVHEEYANTIYTANSQTTFLLHSNNATHHSQGSRKFYNDVANTRFTGTTGHEHAGYFTVGVSGTAFTITGQFSAAVTQPSLRLRRGYSYVFAASSLGSHKFYFANSTANSTGYAYGSDASTNKHLTGMYVSDTQPTFANKGSLTWTAMTSDHYLGSTDSDGYTYLKYEVPTDAPKDLYYRCGAPHGAMGNAVFVMEATEPEAISVARDTSTALPALKTSSWNDRDFTGTGTNNSVINFGDGNLGSGANTTRIQVANNTNWAMSGNFAYEAWIYRTSTTTGQPCIFGDDNDGERISLRTDVAGSDCFTLAIASGTGGWWTSGTRQTAKGGTTAGTGSDYDSVLGIDNNKWYHVAVYTSGSPRDTISVAVNGEDWIKVSGFTHTPRGDTTHMNIGQWTDGAWSWCGFMDNVKFYNGYGANAYDPVLEYVKGRAGDVGTANNSLMNWIKADSTYGDKGFTDASLQSNAITPKGGVHHHIDDNRTANTAMYFDKYSYIATAHIPELQASKEMYTIEGWVKCLDKREQGLFCMGDASSDYHQFSIQGDGAYHNNLGSPACGTFGAAIFNEWHHIAAAQDHDKLRIFQNGICIKETGRSDYKDADSFFMIGAYRSSGTSSAFFYGWMDGVRVTVGMPRYTSGRPTDGQTPHKKYDDGRSSNVTSNTWATSSSRRYYGINTHTYLQTTQYATTANTVLLVRGDDAETANDGVNMYGENGFHLEFKEVGAGTERDYNNFNTGAAGLGSDTSSTGEFADDATVLMVRSRPNQANGSTMFVDESSQNLGGTLGTTYHTAAGSIFGVSSNTANVSIASGGTRSY